MKSIRGNIRLRPTRIALLVKPSDIVSIRKFIRYNSCLWGGQFNPIIPVTNRTPNCWVDSISGAPKGLNLAKEYIKFFEPDVFVQAENGMAEKLGYQDDKIDFRVERVSLLKDFAKGENGETLTYGANVFDTYKHLYNKDYKFVRKHEPKFSTIKNRQIEASFFEVAFGCFPSDKGLKYIAKGYEDVFSPKNHSASMESFFDIIENEYNTPFDVCGYGIKDTYSGFQGPKIFIFNPQNPYDLIDFWNLRIFENDVLPINVEWINESYEFLHNLINKNFRPLPGNPNGVMIRTTVEFSRSLKDQKIEEIINSISRNIEEGSCSFKKWYTNLWFDSTEDTISHPRKVFLEASKKAVELFQDSKDGHSWCDAVHPSFSDSHNFHQSARWANVLNVDTRFSDSGHAGCFPSSKKAKGFPDLTTTGTTLSSREGIVILHRYKTDKVLLNLMSGQSAFIEWFKDSEIEAKPSVAGTTAQEMISALGGLMYARIFTDKEIIEGLNDSASRENKTSKPNDWQRIFNVVEKKKSFSRLPKIVDFIKAKIFQLGVYLKCDHCNQNNWYSIKDVDYNPECQQCLKSFSFPQSETNNIEWRYRVIGPFAKNNYADGGYTTVLTLRLFSEILDVGDNKISYTTGLDFPNLNAEIDFGFWYQRTRLFGEHHEVCIAFGESKSFANEAITQKDVDRLEKIGKKFPGSFLIFSVLKDKLSKKEKEIISKLALKGRREDAYGRPVNPVIILTSTELFSRFNLSQSWEDKGGKHKNFVEPAYVRLSNLWSLADFTQRLYLDLPSIHETRDLK